LIQNCKNVDTEKGRYQESKSNKKAIPDMAKGSTTLYTTLADET
jgi:hypothetical protein